MSDLLENIFLNQNGASYYNKSEAGPGIDGNYILEWNKISDLGDIIRFRKYPKHFLVYFGWS